MKLYDLLDKLKEYDDLDEVEISVHVSRVLSDEIIAVPLTSITRCGTTGTITLKGEE